MVLRAQEMRLWLSLLLLLTYGCEVEGEGGVVARTRPPPRVGGRGYLALRGGEEFAEFG
jgi:hypothetical protein